MGFAMGEGNRFGNGTVPTNGFTGGGGTVGGTVVDGIEGSYIVPEFIAQALMFFVLFNNVVPISLYVSMEMCNISQAFFMEQDLNMYDE